MASWQTVGGSFQNLAEQGDQATKGIWATSQSAGNRQSDPADAMTAIGSSPVDPEISAEHQSDPAVEMSNPPLAPDVAPQSGNRHAPGAPSWRGTA